MIKIPRLVLWLVLAIATAAIPLACGSSSTGSDAATEHGGDAMTPS